MASEEQKKDLKMKLMALAFVLVVGGTAFAIGPGMPKIVERMRKKKATDPEAAKWYYRYSVLYASTFREAQAKELWDEMYLTWSGDEANNESLNKVLEATHNEEWTNHYFIPWIANSYNESNPRPPWLGGEKAPPNPIMQDVLYDYGKWWEDKREYSQARHLYACATYCFPGGTKTAQRLEAAKLRMTIKGWGW